MEFKDCRKLLEQMPLCGGSTDDQSFCWKERE